MNSCHPAAPLEVVLEWLAYGVAAWHAGDTNLDVDYVVHAYLEVLRPVLRLPGQVARDFPWLTMRDIVVLGLERNVTLSVGALSSAPANLEAVDHVKVCRDRRPYRYCNCALPMRTDCL